MKLHVYIINGKNEQRIEALKRFARNKHADLEQQEYHILKDPKQIFDIIDNIVRSRDLALILIPEDTRLSFFIQLVTHLLKYGHYRFKFRIYVYGKEIYGVTTMGFKKERSSLWRK